MARGRAAPGRPAARSLDVGLHLDLTEHTFDAQLRRSLPVLIALAETAGWIDGTGARAKSTAQLEAFEQAVGRAPAHVDGHQHVHQFPVIREALIDVCSSAIRAAALARRTRRPRWIAPASSRG